MTEKKTNAGKTRILLFIITASVLVMLPIVIFGVQQQQELRQRASTSLAWATNQTADAVCSDNAYTEPAPTQYNNYPPTYATPTTYAAAYPTKYPTAYPTKYPTAYPTKYPTAYPTAYPTVYVTPTTAYAAPTVTPTRAYGLAQDSGLSNGSSRSVNINVSFTNSEANKPSTSMDIIATDKQTGATVNLGTVLGGQTKSGVIQTNQPNLSAGTVEFSLTWTDGHGGTDKKTAKYGAVLDCNAYEPSYAYPSTYPTAYANPTDTPKPYGGYANATATPTPPYAEPTSPYAVPTFYCLAAPCPITPEVDPTSAEQPDDPYGSTPTPKPNYQTTEAPQISEAPVEDPCDSSLSSDHGRKKKHKKHKGSVSNGMEQILKFFMQLIELLLQLLGQQQPQPTTPGTNPDPSEPTDVPEEQEPTIDPCAEPDPEEEPTQPAEPEPTEVVPSGTQVAPSVAQPSPSIEVSVAPSTTASPSVVTPSIANVTEVLPSSTAEPSTTTPIASASPTGDPCASDTSLASDNARPSKHKKHNGFIARFFEFFMKIFESIFKALGQQPNEPAAVPSPIPTAEAPITTEEPIFTPAPTQTTAPTQAAATEAPTDAPTVQPSPCPSAAQATVAPSVAPTMTVAPSITPTPTVAVTGNVTSDSTFFQTLSVELINAETRLIVKTQSFTNPQPGQALAFNFKNLNNTTSYLISVSACHTENGSTNCSKPIEVTSCSGTIDQVANACKVTGAGTANFSVLQASLASDKSKTR